jgi:hypothetical protein
MDDRHTPAKFTLRGRRGETFEFSISLTESGSAFPWAEYSFTYTLSYDDTVKILATTANGGASSDSLNGRIRISSAVALNAGVYEHTLDAINTASGAVLPLFSGYAHISR